MSFLNKIFSSDSATIKSDLNWVQLESIAQIDDVKSASITALTLIFKHSTRCGISRMVLKSFEKKWVDKPDVNFYFLNLIQHREVSNAVAEVFNVVHQSPQVIVLENGKVSAHASHYDILNITI